VPLLKLVHVLLAIIALGGSLTFPIWRRRARSAPEEGAFTLRTIRWIDRRIVIPAYALQLVTGIALAIGGGIPLTTGWIALSLALYLFATVIGIAVLGPAGRRQLALLTAGANGTAEYARLAATTSAAETAAVLSIVAIAALMVLKPF
jgi:uncharacterized membrane protein